MGEAADAAWMKHALALADRAAELGEVPVGAVLVADGRLIAGGYNLRESARDPLAHAEIVAIGHGARALGRWRLTGTTLYVTLEPCAMCAGALVNARVDRLVYAASDPRAGAVRTLFRIADDPRLNHRVSITEGVLEDAARAKLVQFFKARR